ncbi:MAG: DUF1559 domain-containing protein, partial [Thermoguttaceae bacterium]
DLNYGKLTENVIQKLKQSGITVWAWTVDDPVLAKKLITWGVGSITTNDPVTILKETADIIIEQPKGEAKEQKPAFKEATPPRISKETTFITEPLTPDGKWVDYKKAFEEKYAPPETKTDDNGFRMIAKRVPFPYFDKISYDEWPKQREEFYEKLGLTYDTKQDLHFQDYNDYITDYYIRNYLKTPKDKSQLTDDEKKALDQLVQKIEQGIGTQEQLEMMKPWIEQNSAALDYIIESLEKPYFYTPVFFPDEHFTYLWEITPHYMSPSASEPIRVFVNSLLIRSTHAISNGDVDAAISDLIAAEKLMRKFTQSGISDFFYSEIYMNSCLRRIGIANNLDAKPDGKQLRRFIESRRNLPKRIGIKQALDSERIVLLDFLQNIARGNGKKLPGTTFALMSSFPLNLYNWDAAYEEINKAYDQGFEIDPRLPPGLEEMFIMTPKNRGERLSCIILNIAKSNPLVIDATLCDDNVQEITLAMLLYNAEHGALPPAFSVDTTGKPLHSWRVLLLPYFCDPKLAEMFDKIRLSEPWDSEYNKQFHDQMPDVYRCPSHVTNVSDAKKSDANYIVVVDDLTPFNKSGKGANLGQFGPNSNGMVLVTETTWADNWMDPEYNATLDEASKGVSCSNHSTNKYVVSSFHCTSTVGVRNGAVLSVKPEIEPAKWWENLVGEQSVLMEIY